MLSRSLLALTALLPFAALAQNSEETYTEKVEDYTFIKYGPKELAPKIEYEWEAAQTALKLFKQSLGPDGMLEVLAPAIAEADEFWKDIVNTSPAKIGAKENWISGDGHGVAFLPNVTAVRFVKWYLSPLADQANNAANPEHYFKRTTVSANGTAQSDILEGWGGVTTHFTVPNFTMPPNRARHPMLNEAPDFPYQAAGDKVLMDGTVFGVLHISVKDVKGADYQQPIDGVHVWASLWYPDTIKDEDLEHERKHMTTEIINLTLQAQKDIESGLLPV